MSPRDALNTETLATYYGTRPTWTDTHGPAGSLTPTTTEATRAGTVTNRFGTPAATWDYGARGSLGPTIAKWCTCTYERCIHTA